MGRIYTAYFEAAGISTAIDLWEIQPVGETVRINTVEFGHDAASVASTTERVAISRVGGDSGSGGSTLTPSPHDGGKQFASTVTALNTTVATTTTAIIASTWNIQAGWFYQPRVTDDIDERIVVPAGTKAVIKLPDAPANTLTMTGRVTFETTDS